MKKILTIVLALVLTLGAHAQDEHMKFMGIPLDGNISTFQNKLSAKGVKPDTQFNASSPVGSRLYYGDFAGYEASFHVYYDKNTKIVYRAKACIRNTDLSIVERYYKEIKKLIQTKYEDGIEDIGEQEGHESYLMTIPEGYVSIYISKYTETYPIQYTIHVDYEDYNNSVKHEKSKLDDI